MNLIKVTRYINIRLMIGSNDLPIATTTPEQPKFFCAPAKMTPNLVTSTGRVRKFEDISQTRSLSPTSGISGNSTPTRK